MSNTLKGKKVRLHDMTLRDGMHPKRHLMSLEQMKSIATGLDDAGIPRLKSPTATAWAALPSTMAFRPTPTRNTSAP